MLSGRIGLASVLALLACVPGGCRSMPPEPAMDFSGAGWVVRQGQAVWRPDGKAGGVAGELLVASHPDGRSVVEFTKTPLPFIVAQRSTNGWQAQFIPRHKTYAGRGAPPARMIWLQLPEAIRGGRAPDGFSFTSRPGGGWRLERLATGESLEGYLETPEP